MANDEGQTSFHDRIDAHDDASIRQTARRLIEELGGDLGISDADLEQVVNAVGSSIENALPQSDILRAFGKHLAADKPSYDSAAVDALRDARQAVTAESGRPISNPDAENNPYTTSAQSDDEDTSSPTSPPETDAGQTPAQQGTIGATPTTGGTTHDLSPSEQTAAHRSEQERLGFAEPEGSTLPAGSRPLSDEELFTPKSKKTSGARASEGLETDSGDREAAGRILTKHDTEELSPEEQSELDSKALGDASKYGAKIGAILKKRIDEGDFKAFALALVLAMINDFVDFTKLVADPTVVAGLALRFIDIFCSAAVWFIVRSEYGFAGRIARKFLYKRFWKYFIANMIPFISVVPLDTMMIFSMNRKIKKEKKKNITAYKEWTGSYQKYGKSIDRISKRRGEELRHHYERTSKRVPI